MVAHSHTPGPWKRDDGFVVAPDGTIICDPHCTGGPDNPEEREANTDLLADAPRLAELNAELVTALQAIQEWSWSLPLIEREHDRMKAVDAVLAKAAK